MNFIVFNSAGRITRTGTCPSSMLPLQGDLIIEGQANDDTQYVDKSPAGEWLVTSKPPMPISVNGLTISNIPIPATVFIAKQVFEVNDGTLELEFDTPGPHQIRVEAFPYLPAVVSIT